MFNLRRNRFVGRVKRLLQEEGIYGSKVIAHNNLPKKVNYKLED